MCSTCDGQKDCHLINVTGKVQGEKGEKGEKDSDR